MQDVFQGKAVVNQSDSNTFSGRKEEMDYALYILTIYSF